MGAERGREVATVPVPAGGGSGLAWTEATLWVGQYRNRKIHHINRDSSHYRVQPFRPLGHPGRFVVEIVIPEIGDHQTRTQRENNKSRPLVTC